MATLILCVCVCIAYFPHSIYLKRQHFNNWFTISQSTYQPQFKHSFKNVLKIQVLVSQSCLTLYDPMDCSLPGSSVHGIFQARVLEWDAIAFSRIWGKELHFVHLCISSHFLVQPALAHCLISSCCCLVAQSCPTLCDPMDCSPPGSSVHGISQARILEWVAISFSRRSSQPRDRIHVSSLAGRFFTSEPPGKLLYLEVGANY